MTTRIRLNLGQAPRAEAQTIDATPTWAAILPALLAVLENGTAEGRAMAREELARMARAADLAGECRAALIDGAAMLSAYSEGRTHNESRGQARATIREMRAALARFSDKPETLKGL